MTPRSRRPDPKSIDPRSVPFARIRPIDRAPIHDQEVERLAKPFSETTVAQKYLGPGWLAEDGTACLLLIAHEPRIVSKHRDVATGLFVAWRWNHTPSMHFSLTLQLPPRDAIRPEVRWFAPSEDQVVQAIYRSGRFVFSVTNTNGQRVGWYEATFTDGPSSSALPSRKALERVFSFETVGIPCSSTRQRFVIDNVAQIDKGTHEIPIWREPVSDFWATLAHDGPWDADLTHRDRAVAHWGAQAWRTRAFEAGHIQEIIERQRFDNEPPEFDELGHAKREGAWSAELSDLVSRHPLAGKWLAAIAGPWPDARIAHEAAIALLQDGPTLYFMLTRISELIFDIGGQRLMAATMASFDAAIRSGVFTDSGTKRPWIANADRPAMHMKAMPIDLEAPLDDIRNMWHSGLELMNLIDAGDRVGLRDFPYPLDRLSEEVAPTVLEGGVDVAVKRIQALLFEAKAARQWSIPWGARVEVHFGPFVAMQIFERDGEFSCHYLDNRDRYFHVAFGLKVDPPRWNATRFTRPNTDGPAQWNDDAITALELIGAAIIRDFLVVEERESVFSCKPFRQRIGEKKVRGVIYLPRVRYNRPHPDRMPLDEETIARVRHGVAWHLRRAAEASDAQRFLAHQYGVQVPKGYTFVRPHERGGATSDVVRIYRSRSASRMIFAEVASAPADTRPAWFEFERDCARLLRRRGLEVVHRAVHRDGDGGVDLYATDPHGGTFIVQCKCWSRERTVGPEVVRELAGAIQLASEGSKASAKGIIITTSAFTSGAATSATSLGYELIDGRAFAKLLEQDD